MAKDYLYKIVSNENVAKIRENGFEPRSGMFGIEQPRVWLNTRINAAYETAHGALIRRKDFHVRYIAPEDEVSFAFTPGIVWRRDLLYNEITGAFKGGEYRLFRPDVYQIITIDRSAVRFFASDVKIFRSKRAGYHDAMQRAVVWTADPIPPSAFIDIRPLDRSYFQSPAFKRFKGEPVATARLRTEATRKRVRWLLSAVDTKDGGLRLIKIRNPDYITNSPRSKRR